MSDLSRSGQKRLTRRHPSRYATAAADPDLVVARIPEGQRRFVTEIPLASSGPWDPRARAAMRAGPAAADARGSAG